MELQLSSESNNKKGILRYVYKYACHIPHFKKIVLIA